MANSNDMTRGKILPVLLKFTLPILVGDMLQQLYNIVDSIIVGRTLGTDALAAVGSTGTLMFLIVGVCSTLANGVAVVTAQRFGAKDPEGVRKSFANGFLLIVLITGTASVISLLFIRPLLHTMNTPEDIYEDALLYITVILAGLVITSCYNYFAASLRAIGNSRVPLYFLMLASVINIVLDLCFIIFLHMGTDGASKATVAAQLLSAAGCAVYIFRSAPELRPDRSDFKPDKNIYLQQLAIAVPMALQNAITGSGSVVMQSAANIFGSTVVAANTAASKVRLMFTQPLISLGQSIASYCGQNCGAGDRQRVKDGVRIAAIMAMLYCVLAAVSANLLLGPALHLFVSSESSIEAMMPWSRTYMIITSVFFIPLGWLFVYRNALQSCGHSVYAMSAGFVELFCRLVCAFAAMHFRIYALAVLCDGSAWLLTGIYLALSFYMFDRRGKLI